MENPKMSQILPLFPSVSPLEGFGHIGVAGEALLHG